MTMQHDDKKSIDNEQTYKGGADWKFALLGGLATASARRVYTAAELLSFVREFRPTASASTARVTADMLVSAGALRRVSSGVFLNKRAVPPAEMEEVAQFIRAGAVISLNSVLGKCGFLNNSTDQMVTAVLPSSATKRPKLGELVTSSGDRFRFLGLAEKFFPKNSQDRFDMLQPGSQCETFRPEAALLQWLHLAGLDRSRVTLPPVDVDMAALDHQLLGELAERWDLVAALRDWQTNAESVNFGEEREAGGLTQPPSDEAIERGADARRRLMSRKTPQ
ncbi:hypothetical protein [Paucibacter soli]|uniref:hypothetical protein n=1 Tax=Paucibacter soli TaxID=3133433 RepID=UPI00309B6C89